MDSLEQELKDFKEKSSDVYAFMEGVVELSDKMRRTYYPDCDLCRNDEFENTEAAFVSASRLTMQSFMEVGAGIDDALVEYIVTIARRALDSPFPLVGDF